MIDVPDYLLKAFADTTADALRPTQATVQADEVGVFYAGLLVHDCQQNGENLQQLAFAYVCLREANTVPLSEAMPGVVADLINLQGVDHWDLSHMAQRDTFEFLPSPDCLMGPLPERLLARIGRLENLMCWNLSVSEHNGQHEPIYHSVNLYTFPITESDAEALQGRAVSIWLDWLNHED